ncbi:MAG: protein-L-isoaspartate(D-aspartate) O-methyltransferase [Gammaproteobacteria bacterium]|nr:MAG: protein-L-isoaspartate(D-aspartate) O-methyltransferase [Gammaproteobacteria bacterium]UCH41956.1 MAG: protein-L-isoaspartate(D-aspartate) O-methyltransferase [Gammaproteobacteria bacterium]
MTSQRTRDRLIQRLQEQGIHNEQVLDVIRRVPRHLFVDEALAHRAYEDTALPIGYGQTISQPFIVAYMTQLLLEDGPANSVLEIGTGCGYQTAVLASIFPQVYSVERIGALHQQAKSRLAELEIYNVQLRHTDGIEGWPNQSYRFDRILMTAACAEIPEALVGQLSDGGVMVLPFDDGSDQTMTKITRTADAVVTESLERVVFVPLLPGLG